VAEEELMLHWSNAAEDAPAHRILAQEDWAQWNEGLSSFEREVLAYFFAGNKPRQIAQALGRSPKSVYNALVRIRGKRKKS
jgi:RNA polymerase sporulation-specific sigma factor